MIDRTESTADDRVDARAEYQRRLVVVRRLMADEGYEAILAADADGWTMPGGNVRYLSGFSAGNVAGLPVHSAVLLPLDGEPTLVVAPGPLGCVAEWARASACMERVQSTPTDAWPPHAELLPDVLRTLQDAGLTRSRIGICGEFPGIEQLGDSLPAATVVIAARKDARGIARDLVERAREVKSDWEVARLRAAQGCTERAITAFMGAVEPGLKLTRAMGAGECAARSEGADEALTAMNSGSDPWMWWPSQGERRFVRGDLVSLETNARVDGYIAQIARSGAIGPPTPVQRRVVETATEALHAMAEKVATGVTGGELWNAAMAVLHRNGLQPWGRFGHGMGLSMAEGIDVMPGNDCVTLDGMCVELHAGVIDMASRQSALVGEQFVVRDDTAVPLSDAVIPFDLAPNGPFRSQ